MLLFMTLLLIWNCSPIVVGVPVIARRMSQIGPIGPNHVPHQGTYRNAEYGYSFIVPKGLIAYSDPAPAPQHGVAIPLNASSQKSYVWVTGSYNAQDFDSLEQFRDYALDLIKPAAGQFEIIRSRGTQLDGIKAARFLVRYRSKQGNAVVLEERILAIRPNGKAIYTLGLICGEEAYRGDSRVLERLLRNWKLIPMTE